MANADANDQAESRTLDDQVRKNLVQVFFGLVLTQMAVYITSLVVLWDVRGEFSPNFMAAWFHLALAFTLTTTSWFGWQISVRATKLAEEASIFQGGFVLSLLDICLVGLYFLLVHQVEITGVAAFPPSKSPTITAPGANAETWIILVVFAIYAVWDWLSYRIIKDKEYSPWPSVTCCLLTALAFYPVYYVWPGQVVMVICTDVYLFCVVILFRALKRFQKWNFYNDKNRNTMRVGEAPWAVHCWVAGWFIGGVFAYLATLILPRLLSGGTLES